LYAYSIFEIDPAFCRLSKLDKIFLRFYWLVHELSIVDYLHEAAHLTESERDREALA
jgi:hypothetical protein